jgi:hypothetical protein
MSLEISYGQWCFVQATVGALGVLSGETRVYGARPILISGSCKRESGLEHAALINAAYHACHKTNLRTICIASDGESRRGEALVRLTFKRELVPTSPIYDSLIVLPLMNLRVGDDDLTADKDYKHVFKRLRNLLLREKGLTVHGVHLKPSVIRSHFFDNNITLTRANYLLNPNDRQDVKLAYDMLHEIWSLPDSAPDKRPGFFQARKAIRTLGALFRHIVMPYICVDLSLSEQLVHLSAAAHLLIALFAEDRTGPGTNLMPTQLYVDIMIMIKNVYFCVAKTKIDNPDGLFWIILLGTDRLETLYGILRTMVGNDANLDLLQLGLRLTGTTEVSTILAKYPHWDRAPRRLKLPSLRVSKDGLSVHAHADHINPASWQGDVKVSCITLQTCWKLGRLRIEEDFPSLKNILHEITESSFDILSPLGKDLITASHDTDEYDDTLDNTTAGVPPPSKDRPPGPDLEDAIAEELPSEKRSLCFEIDGKQVYKARYLNQAFEIFKKPGSTDRLKRVANVLRYASKSTTDYDNVLADDPLLGRDVVQMDSPIATLICCSGQLFLCIGEVIDIVIDFRHADQVATEFLTEPSVFISYQMLCLVPATAEDDPDLKNDWRWSGKRGEWFRVSGCLVQPINPSISTKIIGHPFYLFESSALMAIGHSILERVEQDHAVSVPEIKRSEIFPYCEATGGFNNRQMNLLSLLPLTLFKVKPVFCVKMNMQREISYQRVNACHVHLLYHFRSRHKGCWNIWPHISFLTLRLTEARSPVDYVFDHPLPVYIASKRGRVLEPASKSISQNLPVQNGYPFPMPLRPYQPLPALHLMSPCAAPSALQQLPVCGGTIFLTTCDRSTQPYQ